jgi:hypothetical protein
LPGKDYTKAAIKRTRSTRQSQRQYDYNDNRISVIPNFAKYPINDRLIYGPYEAVKIWASKRFLKIDDYANSSISKPGMVMHSETFLNASILQSIKELSHTHIHIHNNISNDSDVDDPNYYDSKRKLIIPNSIISGTTSNSAYNYVDVNDPKYNYYEIREDRLICFVRVRADGAIWYEDCDSSKSDYGGGYPGGIGKFNITGSSNEKDGNGDTIGYINKIYSLLEVINNNNNNQNNNNNNNKQIPTAKTKPKCRKRRLKDPVRLIYELICK